MNSRIQKILLISLFAMSISGVPSYVFAEDDDSEALKVRIESLEKQLSEIKDLLKQQVQQSATKAEVQAVKKEVEIAKSEQAEWKTFNSGVHLAGYGALNYSAEDNDFSKVLFAPIFHYQYRVFIKSSG